MRRGNPKGWLYLRAFKPGDPDGRYHTLRIDIINPTGRIAKAQVIQEGIIRMEDADSSTIIRRIREAFPGAEVQEDLILNYLDLCCPYMGFRVSRRAA